VSIGEICSDAVELLRPLWSSRRRHGRPVIAVRTQIDQGLTVRGNATELREVLTNLLKNALEALSEAGGTIVVDVAQVDGQTRVRVRDDGPGIPPDVLPKVFDPFFTTKGEKGTGLGLCLSQQIAERHGGELVLESEVGKGTTATMTLPLSATPLHAGGADTSRTARPPDQRGLRVLIVDDDADVLRPLCTFLERCGYAVAAAGDGAHALEAIQDRVPDVLLSDIGMPHMDGIELCQKARARWPQMPVVLMSGWTSEIDAARARALGARALLAKPFAMQQVTDLLTAIARK
jgi:CheY-like chemotaxis protein/anti-sigma regulatory factor (Ser/Thr protein kinase)